MIQKQNQKQNHKQSRTVVIAVIALCILAGIHGLDVYSGVVESGDRWLLGQYGILVFLGISLAGILGILFLHTTKRLETMVLCTALCLGLLYTTVLPPLSAPDEIRHYISAYQLSNRILGLPETAEDGRVIVRAEDWWLEDTDGVYGYEQTEHGILASERSGAKVLGQTLTEETYDRIRMQAEDLHTTEIQDPTESSERTEAQDLQGEGTSAKWALSNHQPVTTTPFAYLMPALGITVARLLGLGSLWLVQLGRMGNLLLFLGAVSFSMRKLPFGKEVLFGVTLLPMTIHLTASFSYDVLILSGVFALTAICLHLTYEAERVRVRDVVQLALIMAIAGPCKMVYAVFMGVCLLIPIRKFGGFRKWLLSAATVGGSWVIAMVLVNRQVVVSYATETDNYIAWAGEAGFDLMTLLHQPVKCFQMFFNTLIGQADYYHMTMIGAYLGNLDTVLNVPYLLVVAFSIGLLVLALRKSGDTLLLTGWKRGWIWLLCAACTAATMFSMLLAWTPISSQTICGVQGRYFLPFLPILLMTLKNDTIVLTKNRDRSILYLMCCANIYVLIRIFSIVCMRL